MMVFNCKACGKPIVFITTVAGKKMPCDAMVRSYEPDADGPDTIITKDGQTVRGRQGGYMQPVGAVRQRPGLQGARGQKAACRTGRAA